MLILGSFHSSSPTDFDNNNNKAFISSKQETGGFLSDSDEYKRKIYEYANTASLPTNGSQITLLWKPKSAGSEFLIIFLSSTLKEEYRTNRPKNIN